MKKGVFYYFFRKSNSVQKELSVSLGSEKLRASVRMVHTLDVCGAMINSEKMFWVVEVPKTKVFL